tara:strand:+ start:271 stop:612 length:342 start_codon:yes stop_codon:yes gene_type:complete
MSKKLNSLEDLAKIKFDSLEPDPVNENKPEIKFNKQFLEAHFSNKGRAGKVVTLIKGFKGSNDELKALAKTIKKEIKVGGTVKNGEILIQGNFRDKIMETLKNMGHEVKRVGG